MKKVFIKLLVIVVEKGIIPTEFAAKINPNIALVFQKNSWNCCTSFSVFKSKVFEKRFKLKL